MIGFLRCLLPLVLAGACVLAAPPSTGSAGTAGPAGAAIAPPAVATVPVVQFLPASEARTVIVDDSREPGGYFSQLQAMEMSAKTGRAITGDTLDAQRDECRARYQAAVLEFSEPEKAAVREYIGRLYPALARDYPVLAATPWSFIKLADSIEGGLPHTRGAHIVLSPLMCQQMLLCRNVPRGAVAMVQILVHEQMHVVQRADSARFDSLYIGQWGFVKATSITGCAWLDKQHLADPDGTDCCWVFPVEKNGGVSYIWPLVVFAEGAGLKRLPMDFQMLAIEVEKKGTAFAVKVGADGRPVAHALTAEEGYCARFGGSGNAYHPHEACADLFAKLVVYDQLVEKMRLPQEARQEQEKKFAALRRWFKANLGACRT